MKTVTTTINIAAGGQATSEITVERVPFVDNYGKDGIRLKQDEDLICLTYSQAKSLMFALIDVLPDEEKH